MSKLIIRERKNSKCFHPLFRFANFGKTKYYTMSNNTTSNRIASIDIFRALTMLTMLFVNDFAGIQGIPHWLGHAEANEDMMGFSDLVFPAFLFCMGLSIPFAVASREKKGDSLVKVGVHIALRSLALVVMGLFAMNCSSMDGVMSTQVFQILMVLGFFMVWNCYPKAEGRTKAGHWYCSTWSIDGPSCCQWSSYCDRLVGYSRPYRLGISFQLNYIPLCPQMAFWSVCRLGMCGASCPSEQCRRSYHRNNTRRMDTYRPCILGCGGINPHGFSQGTWQEA